MYKVGDRIKYITTSIRSQNKIILSQEKIGTIEEAFSTIDNKPCYWIVGEKELILGCQIIGTV